MSDDDRGYHPLTKKVWSLFQRPYPSVTMSELDSVVVEESTSQKSRESQELMLYKQALNSSYGALPRPQMKNGAPNAPEPICCSQPMRIIHQWNDKDSTGWCIMSTFLCAQCNKPRTVGWT